MEDLELKQEEALTLYSVPAHSELGFAMASNDKATFLIEARVYDFLMMQRREK